MVDSQFSASEFVPLADQPLFGLRFSFLPLALGN